jgi:hypothetical protein
MTSVAGIGGNWPQGFLFASDRHYYSTTRINAWIARNEASSIMLKPWRLRRKKANFVGKEALNRR